MIYTWYIFYFLSWGFLPLQSYWSMSSDQELDYGDEFSGIDKSNNNVRTGTNFRYSFD